MALVALAAALASLLPAATASADPFGPQLQITNFGTPGDTTALAGFHDQAYSPVARRHLVVFIGTTDPLDNDEERDDVYGQFTDDAGNRIGGAFKISQARVGTEEYNPATVAYNPSRNQWLVAWDDDEQVVVRLLAADGTPLTNQTPISGDQGDVETETIAYNPDLDEFFLAWKGDGGVGGNDALFGRRVSANGLPLGTDVAQVGGSEDLIVNDATSVVYNDTNNEYLAAFRAQTDGAPSEYEIYAQRISAAGTPVGPPNIRVSQVGPDGVSQFAVNPPDVVWNARDNHYLVAWSGDDNAGSLVDNEREVFGQLLAADGTQFGPDDFRVSNMGPDGNTDYSANRPRLAYSPNANEYLATWHGTDGVAPVSSDDQEVYGQRLSSTGAQIGTDDFRVSTTGIEGDPTTDANRPVASYNSRTCEFLITWFTGDAGSGDNPDQEWEVFGRRVASAACPPEDPAADTVAPRISRLSVTNKVFEVVQRRRARSSQDRPRSTTFRYTVSEAARVRFGIQKRTVGRRAGGRCRKATARNRSARKCVRWVRVGGFSQQADAGANRRRFTGRIGRRKLKPGRYRARLRARDAAGNASRLRGVRFRVVAG